MTLGEQVLVVPVGHDQYAVPLESALEVISSPALTRLVTAPAIVLGLFNLRGSVVPLLDTAALVGTGEIDAVTFAVVVSAGTGMAALTATALPYRASLEASVGSSELPGTAGRYQVSRKVVVLLNLALLLTVDGLQGVHSSGDLVAQGSN